MSRWKKVAVLLVAAYFLVAAIGSCSPRDATDPPSGARSGMLLRTDHATGCQYLAEPFGGITPRVDADGRHMGVFADGRLRG